jgi:hypothetical protein
VSWSYILCLIKRHTMKTCWGNGGVTPCIFNLGIRYRWVVNFMPQLLYSQDRSPWYLLYRRLGGPQSWSEPSGKEKKSHRCPHWESNLGCPAHSLVSVLSGYKHSVTVSEKILLWNLFCVHMRKGHIWEPYYSSSDVAPHFKSNQILLSFNFQNSCCKIPTSSIF